jgi:hypothetical protein
MTRSGARQGFSLLLVLLFGVDQLDSPGCGSVANLCGRQNRCAVQNHIDVLILYHRKVVGRTGGFARPSPGGWKVKKSVKWEGSGV